MNQTTCENANGYWCTDSDPDSCVAAQANCTTTASTQLDISCTPSSVGAGDSFSCQENSDPKIPVAWSFNGTNAAKDCADDSTLLTQKTCIVDDNYGDGTITVTAEAN